MPRGSLDDVLALLWGGSGMVVAGYFVYLGVGPGAVGNSGPLLLGLATIALVGFTTVAVRHHRRAREARAERESGPVGGWRVQPSSGKPSSGERRLERKELSPSGKAELARIVGIADRAGLFGPRAPRPVDLMEAVADAGEPVTLLTVLGALPEQHRAAVAFHEARAEQSPDTLAAQVADLARLVGDVRLLEVEVGDDGRTRLRLRLGDEERTLDYRGHPEHLSTVLHATVARAVTPRLAWSWSDRGVWIAAPRTSVAALNADLGRAVCDPWTWVDEQPPTAAGDAIRRSRRRG